MELTLEETLNWLSAEVNSFSEMNGSLTEEAFFQVFTDEIIAAGEIDNADRCYFKKLGMRIDGYGSDPIDSDNELNVIVADYSSSETIENVNKLDIENVCKRSGNFISKCLSQDFINEMDVSSPEYGFEDMVRLRWKDISKIRIIFITNKSLSIRKTEFHPLPILGIKSEFICWDINRLQQYKNSGKEKEPISIKLEDFGGAISALNATNPNDICESYLCIMPGETLAKIYEKFGNRLLEKNVRVFLQARKKSVNDGIKTTIEKEPGMFFCYNNGLTATACNIKKSLTNHGIAIDIIDDFQIVNGGQTTASIFYSSKRDVDISDVKVQMKLTVVEDKKSQEIVPKISEYANSQNKVNKADFFSNHPFHRVFKKLSDLKSAPPAPGSNQITYWFYERVRGEYAEAKQSKSKPERKTFDNIYPRKQLVTKTDLSIVLNSFEGYPDIVSKGAQKSFQHFSVLIREEWDKQGLENKKFNDQYFISSMSKVLIFRIFEKLVSSQEWYEKGGYRRNIVTYSLAKLNMILKQKGLELNFEKIWKNQTINEDLEEILLSIGFEAQNHIENPPEGTIKNRTEYAKKKTCWDLFKKTDLDLPDKFDSFTISKSEGLKIRKEGIKLKKMDNEFSSQMQVINYGGSFWTKVLEFSNQNNLLLKNDWILLRNASSLPKSISKFNDRDWNNLLKLLERARSKGFSK